MENVYFLQFCVQVRTLCLIESNKAEKETGWLLFLQACMKGLSREGIVLAAWTLADDSAVMRQRDIKGRSIFVWYERRSGCSKSLL